MTTLKRPFLVRPLSISAMLLFCFAFPASFAHAQDPGMGFTITPPVFELKANPGDKMTESISLFNNSSEDLLINTTIENLQPVGEKGQVTVVEGQADALPSLKDWISVALLPIKLAKGETINVPFSLDIPQNAQPGGHFATILFATTSSSVDAGTGSKLSQKVGSLVFLTVAGQAIDKALTTEFRALNDIFYKDQNVDFSLKIRNDGNTYIRPRGFLIINNILGQKVAEIEIDGKNILPTAQRETPLSYALKNAWGPYTATISLVYGSTNQNINATTGFWVIPIIPIAIFLALIIIIFLLRKRLWLAIQIILGRKKIS